MERKAHWKNIYATKRPTDVSWYQPHADLSLAMIRRAGIQPKDDHKPMHMLLDECLPCKLKRKRFNREMCCGNSAGAQAHA